jgi:hypothetical protein
MAVKDIAIFFVMCGLSVWSEQRLIDSAQCWRLLLFNNLNIAWQTQFLTANSFVHTLVLKTITSSSLYLEFCKNRLLYD